MQDRSEYYLCSPAQLSWGQEIEKATAEGSLLRCNFVLQRDHAHCSAYKLNMDYTNILVFIRIRIWSMCNSVHDSFQTNEIRFIVQNDFIPYHQRTSSVDLLLWKASLAPHTLVLLLSSRNLNWDSSVNRMLDHSALLHSAYSSARARVYIYP